MTVVEARDEDRIYSSRGINVYLQLITQKYPHVDIQDLLQYAGMKPYEVADQGYWFTQRQIDRFYEKARLMSGNDNIAREAGRYAASTEVLGVLRQYVLGQVGLANAYGMIGSASENYARSAIYRTRKLSTNRVEIEVTPKTGIREKPYQCDNRIGLFEAVALAFTNKLPQVEHRECIFAGNPVCRYIITWENTRSAFWLRIRNLSALGLMLVCAAFGFVNISLTLTALLPATVTVILLLTLAAHLMESRELQASLSNLRQSSDDLIHQVNVNYNNVRLTHEIGQAISRKTHSDDILSNVVSICEKRLDYDRGMILLATPDKGRLKFCTGFGYSAEQLMLLKNTQFHLDNPHSRGVFVVSFRKQKPFLINDFRQVEEDLSARSLAFARRLGAKSFVCCPIICDNESLGILAVDNLQSKRLLVESDLRLLMGIAQVIGVSIRNAELLEAKLKQFRSIIQVLAASIDARDPLTAGHSEKVTRYSGGICRELGLSAEYTDVIEVAGLLHDYGKIGVSDAILKKKGGLTPQEYRIIQTHAPKTREILSRVNFEGIFSLVPEIAGSHHEKLDGSGYPRGLKGEEIPLGAKIIAVADFFEAITSQRHYRNPMPLQEAVDLLRSKSGNEFEADIVEAFLRFYRQSYQPEKENQGVLARFQAGRQPRAQISGE